MCANSEKPEANASSFGRQSDGGDDFVNRLADLPPLPQVEETLEGVDSVIRACCPPEPLNRVFRIEPSPLQAASNAALPHHPESLLVLCRCRCRHPAWHEFPAQTVRVTLYRMLNERWTGVVWRRIASETPQTARRVLNRLIALSPDGSDEDAPLVWCRLAAKYPGNTDYRYTRPQAFLAWRAVRQLRWRNDHLGAGGPESKARKQRNSLLRQLARELQWSPSLLRRLDVDDYNPFDGTISTSQDTSRRPMHLSRATQEKTEKWLLFRGCTVGRLFELPVQPEFCETSAPVQLCHLAESSPCGRQDACTLDEEDALEWLCRGQDLLAAALVLKQATYKGGNWSVEFVDRLRRRCGAFADHSFSRYERRQCRKLLGEARERLERACLNR